MVDRSNSTTRKSEIAIDTDLMDEAERLGIDANAVAESAVKQAIARTRETRWLEENREAIDSYNAWVEKNGLPLAKYRMF